MTCPALLPSFHLSDAVCLSSPTHFQLYEFDDVRTIYMKYLEFDPSNTAAWVKWAQLEAGLGDLERARYLFDLGTTQELDMPEVLWKVRLTSSAFVFLCIPPSRLLCSRELTRSLSSTLLAGMDRLRVRAGRAREDSSFVRGSAVEDWSRQGASRVFPRSDLSLRTSSWSY